MRSQCQDLGEAAVHGELGRDQKKEDGPGSHLGVMWEPLSGVQTSSKGPILAESHGAPQLYSPYPWAGGSCFIFFHNIQPIQSILFPFSHNEHSHSASTFIKLLIYVKYWIICYCYNLKKQTLQEESSDNRKGG